MAYKRKKQEVCRLEGEKKVFDEALQAAKMELLPVEKDWRVSRRYARVLLIDRAGPRQCGMADRQGEAFRVERATTERLVGLADSKVKVAQAFEEPLRKDRKACRRVTVKLKKHLCDAVERRDIEKQGMVALGKTPNDSDHGDLTMARFVAEEATVKATKSAVTRELVLEAAHRGV
ncbi:hypothetical protein LTR56_026818 [Elasticomyces elasticus]|nr:hypothetical protein LTR56_026818 [Elasticomyces elasticus]KAK3617802.1 hypothetical protein LTR22_026610 [Elasticomyces elasticus]KAK4903579.1 hypothetical protein LTR49_026803 [Elasticomyces elasticus]